MDVGLAWPVLTFVGMCPATASRVNAITERVMGAAIRVHRALGPGLLITFNTNLLTHGIRRVVNRLPEE